MNYDKTVVYDERPGFESYNAVSFPYPGGMNNMGMMPIFPNNMMSNMQNSSNSCSQVQNTVNNLEQKVNNLENRIQKLESSLYPKAMDYSQSSTDYLASVYQNSMNIM